MPVRPCAPSRMSRGWAAAVTASPPCCALRQLRPGGGPARSCLAPGDDEQAGEGEQQLAVLAHRIVARDAALVFGQVAGALRFIESGHERLQSRAADPVD